MLALLLSIAFSVTIAHLFKWAQKRQLSILTLFFVNYAMATGIALLTMEAGTLVRLSRGEIGMAVGLGIFFITTFYIYQFAIARLGVSISVTLMRLAVLIPILAAIIWLHEVPGIATGLAAGLILLAIPLASPRWGQPGIGLRSGLATLWPGLLLFVAYGLTDFGLKLKAHLFGIANKEAFLAVLFATSTFIALLLSLRQRLRPGREELFMGLALGLVNYASTYFFLIALNALPAYVASPINSAGIILLAALSGKLLWHEQLSFSQYLFFTLAAIAVALIYI
jgi:drug/metabolite transporter (DMT)-like permease